MLDRSVEYDPVQIFPAIPSIARASASLGSDRLQRGMMFG
jgi:hypothetical protein